MKIAVCVKQVPENDGMKLNQADLFAVELALQLKETTKAELEAVTMGAPAAEAALRDVIAMGADSGTLITGKAFAGSDTYGTSAVLAAAIKETGGADVVFCGTRSSDGDTGQMGAFLAARLGIPYFSRVISIDPGEEGLILTRRTEFREERIRVKPPVLVSVLEKSNHPRYATLERLLYSLDAPIRVLGEDLIPDRKAAGVGQDSPTQVVDTCQAEMAGKCAFLTGETMEDLAAALEDCLAGAGCPISR